MGVSIIFIPVNPFHYLSLSFWCVCVYACVFCLFTPFLSVLFVFHRRNLVLYHLINRFMTFTSEKFLKRTNIVESKSLASVNYSFNEIKTAAMST